MIQINRISVSNDTTNILTLNDKVNAKIQKDNSFTMTNSDMTEFLTYEKSDQTITHFSNEKIVSEKQVSCENDIFKSWTHYFFLKKFRFLNL